MNVQFAIAGVLALVGAAIHGGVGERIVVSKLRPEVLSPTKFGGSTMTLLMIRVTWHIVTLVFVIVGSAMIACAPAESSRACQGVGRLSAISFASFAALAITLATTTPRGALRTVRAHPGPLVFVLVAVLAWWGS